MCIASPFGWNCKVILSEAKREVQVEGRVKSVHLSWEELTLELDKVAVCKQQVKSIKEDRQIWKG